MRAYDPGQSLRDARDVYFSENDFGANGGYDEPWARVKVGPIVLHFPNTPGRKRAIRFHDLHHIVTGYDTSRVGESEIAGWQLGSGCLRTGPVVALFNLTAFFAGLLFAPRRVLRAYSRGRRSRNLYARRYDDALLDTTVGQARNELGLDPAPSTALTLGDAAHVALYALLAVPALLVFPPMVAVVTAIALPLSWVSGRNRSPAM
ncbi:hypothetical protein [Pendulispora albinea]|uniref:Uncharacterized protein n=1 Tax=Pendulispora albinea TaxID=2741071 RepID=A0ABZ2M3I1_9BACT